MSRTLLFALVLTAGLAGPVAMAELPDVSANPPASQPAAPVVGGDAGLLPISQGQEIRQLREQVRIMEKAIDDLRIAKANSDNQNLTKIVQLTDQLRVAEANSRATKTNDDLAAKYAEVSTQRDFLLQQVKLLREQIAILQDRLNNAASENPGPRRPGATSRPESPHPAAARPTIKGLVKAVADNQLIATIDIGANDGVTENMEFYVFRGGKFLAMLVTTRVDAKNSVGRLEKVQDRVQIGDKAWNQLSAN